MNEADPRRLVFSYTRMMLASLLLNPEPERILMAGLGGGSLVAALNELLPDAALDVVEIDPAVVHAAREFFDFHPSGRTRVVVRDARVFIKRALREGQRYDVVMLDAYGGDYIPEHLMTVEFLAEVGELLAPGGVLVANTFAQSRLYDPRKRDLSRRLRALLQPQALRQRKPHHPGHERAAAAAGSDAEERQSLAQWRCARSRPRAQLPHGDVGPRRLEHRRARTHGPVFAANLLREMPR